MFRATKFDFTHSVGSKDYPWIINYSIHDNMGSPYRAEVNKKNKTLTLFMLPYDYETGTSHEKFLKRFRYSRIWPGIDTDEPQWAGNTLLFQEDKTNKFIWIGDGGIQELTFPRGEEILLLFSPVGNSDVPYPYIVGKKNTYLLSERVYIPTNKLNIATLLKHDKLYDDYYTGKLPSTNSKPRILADRECPWDGSCKM